MNDTEQNTNLSNDNTADSQSTTSNQQNALIVRKFELAIFNEDLKDDGRIELKQERLDKPLILGVKTYAELLEKLNIYKQCGQIAKIVREVDPPAKDEIEYYNQIFYSKNPKEALAKAVQPKPAAQTSSDKVVVQEVKRQKPKYYKIGDIDIKDDNGKIYQKQWMKLSDSECQNFRIINDKNNSIVNLNGKHLEMKKWILVENTEDETTNLEENLNV